MWRFITFGFLWVLAPAHVGAAAAELFPCPADLAPLTLGVGLWVFWRVASETWNDRGDGPVWAQALFWKHYFLPLLVLLGVRAVVVVLIYPEFWSLLGGLIPAPSHYEHIPKSFRSLDGLPPEPTGFDPWVTTRGIANLFARLGGECLAMAGAVLRSPPLWMYWSAFLWGRLRRDV